MMELPTTQVRLVPTAIWAGKPSIISAGVTIKAPPTPAKPLKIPALSPVRTKSKTFTSMPGILAKVIN
jgi:hypothetical protein